jgi:hypothetical protein
MYLQYGVLYLILTRPKFAVQKDRRETYTHKKHSLSPVNKAKASFSIDNKLI